MTPESTGLLHPSLRPARTIRIGVVSFLNALPLRHHLLECEGLRVRPAVPSALAEMLEAGSCDVALLPVVDYLRRRDELEPVSDACIASDGETLTVRVFSRVPSDRIRRLHVDTDSHTSIILARLIWKELYSTNLEIVPRPAAADAISPDDLESVLLIGDKVVREAPRGFGFVVDLGAAWKHLCGLPFVFAAWYGLRGRDWTSVASLLEAARSAGEADAEKLARQEAARHGWPEALAVEYLTRIMKYRITPAMRAGMDRFFSLVEQHGLLP